MNKTRKKRCFKKNYEKSKISLNLFFISFTLFVFLISRTFVCVFVYGAYKLVDDYNKTYPNSVFSLILICFLFVFVSTGTEFEINFC